MDHQVLERLGHHIVSRRVALGYRDRTDLPNSLQFTVRTLSDIENGVRKASAGSYAILENTLARVPGSIDTILAGGEPKQLVATLRREGPETRHRSFTTDDAFSQTSTEELWLELRRRIGRPRDRRSESWDDGDGLDSQGDRSLNSRGDWPDEG
jgi:hypothetical protein